MTREQEYYQTQSLEQLEKLAFDCRADINADLQRAQEYRTLAQGKQQRLETIMAEIGRRNYEVMISSFVLTRDHVRLLREYGVEGASDLDDMTVATFLGWVKDREPDEGQQRMIARLIAELKYAQDWINRHADGLVDLQEAK